MQLKKESHVNETPAETKQLQQKDATQTKELHVNESQVKDTTQTRESHMNETPTEMKQRQ